MPRNIILLSDGTGHGSSMLFRTNIWRIFRGLDLSTIGQIAFYDDGVGSSKFKPLAVLGGAFGWGLKRNLLDIYTFLCRNYVEGDTIYGFGFSRGAFTIRVLANFILSQGIVTDFDSADDLRRKARHLYRKYRETRQTTFGIVKAGRAIRNLMLWPIKPRNIEVLPIPAIRFLGVWDTVDAYGLPIASMKRGVDRYIWPLALEDRSLDPRIAKACHALSIDDKRATFHPLLWDESSSGDMILPNHTDDEVLTQLWFSGVHQNVGGGYGDDSLSLISLRWMVGEAVKTGVLFRPQFITEIEAGAAFSGKLHDSRAGFGNYYPYQPRSLDPPRDVHGAVIPNPKVHETVIWRIAAGTDAYAPLSLPGNLRVVTDLPIETTPDQAQTTVNVYALDAYCEALRVSETLSCRAGALVPHQDRQRIANAVSALQKADDSTIDLIWDTVWWRKIAHFATLATTAIFFLLPVILGSNDLSVKARNVLPEQYRLSIFPFLEFFDPLIRLRSALHQALTPLLVSLIGTMDDYTPGFMHQWFLHYEHYPWRSFALLVTIASLVRWSKYLDRRIHDRALAAWNSNWRAARYRWLHDSEKGRFVTAATVIVIAILVLYRSVDLLFQANALVHEFVQHDNAEGISDTFFAAIVARQSILIFEGFVCVLLIIAGSVWILWVRRIQESGAMERREMPGFALWLARTIRKSPIAASTQRLFAERLAPFFFALALIFAAVVGLNRFAFAIVDAGGWVCLQNDGSDEPLRSVTRAEGSVSFLVTTNKGCHSSHLRLIEGATYFIKISDAKDWKIRSLDPKRIAMGPPGFWTPLLKAPYMISWIPFRRYWTLPWLSPIIRVGSSEVVLKQSGTFLKAEKSGELFFFVNDVVIGWPSLWDFFYKGNKGDARIIVKLIDDPPDAD